jgi:hypothetical protein
MILVQFKKWANSQRVESRPIDADNPLKELEKLLIIGNECHWMDVLVDYRLVARKCYGSAWHNKAGAMHVSLDDLLHAILAQSTHE